MATFRINQRVRVVRITRPEWAWVQGKEATIITMPGNFANIPDDDEEWYGVKIDGVDQPGDGIQFVCEPSSLEPLEDPKSKQFIESIKKLTPQLETA